MCIKIGISHRRYSDVSQVYLIKNNNGWIPFSFRVPVSFMLARCHDLLYRLNGSEPSLILLVTPVLFLPLLDKMSAMNRPALIVAFTLDTQVILVELNNVINRDRLLANLITWHAKVSMSAFCLCVRKAPRWNACWLCI